MEKITWKTLVALIVVLVMLALLVGAASIPGWVLPVAVMALAVILLIP